MLISIINEPRSGSSNLASWFSYREGFTVWFLPSYSESICYQNGVNPKDYKYSTEHLILKEDFFLGLNFDDLIVASDKIIILHRLNEIEQFESLITCLKTNEYNSFYKYEKDDSDWAMEELVKFKELKRQFNEKYIDKHEFFTITYEELYYQNGFKKILNYLNIDGLKNVDFPMGEKCRIFDTAAIPTRKPKTIQKLI